MRIGKMARSKREKMTVLTLILPALVSLVPLEGYSLLRAVHDSFFHVSLTKPGTGLAGLNNFKTVMADEQFRQTVVSTIYWIIFSVLRECLVRMATAVLLNREFRGRAFFKIMIFIPWLVLIIATDMTWDWVLNTEFGIVNFMLNTLHITNSPTNFLGDAKYAMAVVILTDIWGSSPYYTTSFLSTIQSIFGGLMEVAAIDGAGVIKRFFYIALSQLKPASLVIVFLRVVWAAINSDFIWILTEGDPNYAAQVLPIMIYRHPMKKSNVGITSASSAMTFIIMTAMFMVYYRQRMRISEFLE